MDKLDLFKILFLIINFFVIIWVYMFFVFRIKDINKKHIKYTKVDYLAVFPKKLNKILFVIFTWLFACIVFISLKCL